MGLSKDGYDVFGATQETLNWAQAAHGAACRVVADAAMRSKWLRHQGTWFVGVDALPNAPDGSIGGAALHGPWQARFDPPDAWHPAQISVTYPGYPMRDNCESEASHRFRVNRCAAHVDGLLPESGRRYLREPHAFILGIALNTSDATPLKVWPRSHVSMGKALAEAIGDAEPSVVDLTATYKAARAQVFEESDPVSVPLKLGESVLLHRHLLHGIAPWEDGMTCPAEGRMTAYFRPQLSRLKDWL